MTTSRDAQLLVLFDKIGPVFSTGDSCGVVWKKKF